MWLLSDISTLVKPMDNSQDNRPELKLLKIFITKLPLVSMESMEKL